MAELEEWRKNKNAANAPNSLSLFKKSLPTVAAASREESMNKKYWKNEHHTTFRLTSPISELQRYGLEKKKRNWKINVKNKQTA